MAKMMDGAGARPSPRPRRALAAVAALAALAFAGCGGDSSSEIVIRNVSSDFLLQVASAPPGGTVNVPLGAFEVALFDPFGRPLTTTTAPVSVRLSSAQSAQLTGTLTVTPQAGTARFDDLVIDAPGQDFVLTFTAPGFAPVSSAPLDISTGIAAGLAFATQPQDSRVGARLAAVEVAVQDAAGATVTSATSVVSLRLETAPMGAMLGGTVTRSAVNGVARFDDLVLDTEGSYSFTAESAGVTSATSASFAIAATNIAQLSVRAQPTMAVRDGTFDPVLEVAVEDAMGNLVTDAAAPVTVAISASPQPTRLFGTRTVVPQGGIARFGDLRLGDIGAGFELTASLALVQTSVATAPFEVVFDAPDVSNLSAPTGDLRGLVPLTYTLTQGAGARVDLRLEFDAGAGYAEATLAPITSGLSSQGARGVRSSAAGRDAVLLWDSARDLAGQRVASLSLRLTAALEGQDGVGAELTGLVLDNRALLQSVGLVSVGDGPRAVVAADFDRDGDEDLAVAEQNANTVSIYLQDAGSFVLDLVLNAGTGPSALAAKDLDGDGLIDLAIANQADDTVTVRLQQPGVSLAFGAPLDLSASLSPVDVAAADLNGDGRLDLVVAHDGAGLTLHLQDAANPGSFFAAQSLSAGTNPSAVAVADLDGDGLNDLAVANRGSSDLSIRLQDAASPGSFLAAASLSVSAGPADLVAIDLDGDGQLDLAVACETAGEVNVLRQLSGQPGSFMAAAPFSAGAGPRSLVSVDFDGDGRPDLATANGSGGTVARLRQDPATPGAFLAAETLSVGAGPSSLAALDLGQDGRPDLACALFDNDDLAILMSSRAQPAGLSLAGARLIGAAVSPRSVALADIDGDGRLDLLTGGADGLSLQLGDGRGAAEASLSNPLDAGVNPGPLALGDLDSDGQLEVALASLDSGTVTIFGRNPLDATTLRSLQQLDAGAPIADLALAFIGSDGLTDLVASQPGDDRLAIFEQDPANPGSFSSARFLAAGASPGALAVADLNGDLQAELAVANVNSATVTLLTPDPAGSGQVTTTTLMVGDSPSDVTLRDVDGDGRLDLIVANAGSNDISLLLQDPANPGAFLPESRIATGLGPIAVDAADLNGDGALDLITADAGAGTLTILPQDPNLLGTFLAPITRALAGTPSGLSVGDFDGDLRADLAVALADRDRAELLLQGGPAMVDAAMVALPDSAPSAVIAADIDGDGRLDLVSASEQDGNFSVLLQDPANPGLTLPAQTFSVSSPSAIAAADVNRDGRLDLIFANASAGTASILFQSAANPATFPTSATVSLGTNPRDLIVADLDGDGLVDIAAANLDSADVTVALQDASAPGSFLAAQSITVGAGATDIAAADLNGDGRLDLVVNATAAELVVILQDSAVRGDFAVAGAVSLSAPAAALSLADLNGDGLADIAASLSGGGLALRLRDPAQPVAFAAERTLNGDAAVQLSAADIDGDGRADLVLAQALGAEVRAQDASTGLPGEGLALAAGADTVAAIALDFNGDGRPDLLSASRGRGVIVIHLGR